MNDFLKYENARERRHNLSSPQALQARKSELLAKMKNVTTGDARAYLLQELVLLKKEEAYRMEPYDLGMAYDNFDGKAFPITDMATMVRCVHEGVCPTCGRDFDSIVLEDVGSKWDWQRMTGTCFAGHVHTAEPNECDNDWVAW